MRRIFIETPEAPPSPVKEAYAKKCVLGTGEERHNKSVPAQLWTEDGDQKIHQMDHQKMVACEHMVPVTDSGLS